MAWFCFVDWLDIPAHFGARAAKTLNLTATAGRWDDLPAYALDLHDAPREFQRERDFAVLDAVLSDGEGLRLGLRIEPCGLIAMAVYDPRPHVPPPAPDPGLPTGNRARLMALLCANMLAGLFGCPQRLNVSSDADLESLVVPTTTLWPVDVTPSQTRQTEAPETVIAELVMRRLRKGSLKTRPLDRGALGWVPGAQRSRLAHEALLHRAVVTTERHIERIDGHKRTDIQGIHGVQLRPTETLLTTMFNHAFMGAIAVALMWLGLMILTMVWPAQDRFVLTTSILWWWTLWLCVVTGLLLLSTLLTNSAARKRSNRGAKIAWIFRSPWRIWGLVLSLPVALLVLIWADPWPNMSGGGGAERQDAASYRPALTGVVWALPAPMLLALVQAQPIVRNLIALESTLRRKILIVERLKKLVASAERLVARNPVPVDDPQTADLARLSTRLDDLDARMSKRGQDAEQRFEISTKGAAALAFMGIVFQTFNAFKPADIRSSPGYLVQQINAAASSGRPSGVKAARGRTDSDLAGCQGTLPDWDARHPETINAALLARMFECIDTAHRQAQAASASMQEEIAALGEKLPGTPAPLSPYLPRPVSVSQLCDGPRALPCVSISSDTRGQVNALKAAVTELDGALSGALDKLDALRAEVTTVLTLDTRAFHGSLAGATRHLQEADLDRSVELHLSAGAAVRALDALRKDLDVPSQHNIEVTLNQEPFDKVYTGIKDDLAQLDDVAIRFVALMEGQTAPGDAFAACTPLGEYRFDSGASTIPASTTAGWHHDGSATDPETIRQAIVAAHNAGQHIFVLGSADPRGSDGVNSWLAETRAGQVADAVNAPTNTTLLSMGSKGWMAGFGLPAGEDDPDMRMARIYGCAPAVAEAVTANLQGE